MTAHEHLPLLETVAPHTEEEVAALVADAARRAVPIYPLGGGTAQRCGLPITRPGIGLSLAHLQRVVDYPARDMTITVEAGLTLDRLQAILAPERQWLPVDPPSAELAQLGGMVAMNASGPRRYAYGTPREYVIGIRAIDGRGVPFQAGGRVVKNVAGYDFCRLLAGSRGTLAIITGLTLKLRPRPASQAILQITLPNWEKGELALNRLNLSTATPTAIQLDARPSRHRDQQPVLSLLVEGTDDEVAWQLDRLEQELQPPTGQSGQVLGPSEVADCLRDWQQFPVSGPGMLRFRVHVQPHATVGMIEAIQRTFPAAEILAQGGSGIMEVSVDDLPSQGLTAAFSKTLIPQALQAGGYLVITHHATGQELTHELFWGSAPVAWRLMHQVRRQFDPHGIFNPLRYFPS